MKYLSTDKKCPKCSNSLVKTTIYYCRVCREWYEEIDFLTDQEKKEADSECETCDWLTPTKFTRGIHQVFYCNCLESKSAIEKIKDFRKCKYYIHITYLER